MKKTTCLFVAGSLFALGAANAAVTSHDWKMSVDLGASFASGNTDSTLVTLGFDADRELEFDLYSINASYAWGEEDGVTTSDAAIFDAAWKHLLSERSYAGLRVDFIHDDLADVDYRASLTALAGYFFINNDTTKFFIEGGPGYTFEKQGGMSDDYLNLYLGEGFDHQLTPETKIFQSLAIFARAEDVDDFQIIAEAGLETKLSDSLNFRVVVEDRYENIPAAGRTENDVRVITGLSYSF